MFRRLRLIMISAALYVHRYVHDDPIYNHMRVLSPDACGATRRHQRIHACAKCHGARVLERMKCIYYVHSVI